MLKQFLEFYFDEEGVASYIDEKVFVGLDRCRKEVTGNEEIKKENVQ
jgi:hypothetical protein